MNNNLLTQYQISLDDKIFEWEDSEKEIIKVIETFNTSLTNFLNDWHSVQQIDESLLPDVEKALTKPTLEVETDSIMVEVTMINNFASLYNSEGFDISIPLEDFREIIFIWRQFLSLEPSKNANPQKSPWWKFNLGNRNCF